MAISNLATSPPFIIKVIALVISVVTAVLTTNQQVGLGPDTLVRYAVVDGTIVTFIVLGVLTLLGYIIGHPLHKKLILLSSGGAVILFLVSGGLILDSYVRDEFKDVQVCFGGILALLNGLMYAADVFLSWKYS